MACSFSGLDRAEQRGFLVEGFSVCTTRTRVGMQSVATARRFQDERRARGVPCGVPTRFVGVAYPAGRE
jgi:hypothetical protein